MAKELKIRISNAEAMSQRLVAAGAKPKDPENSRHTYFRQPAGKALKIVESPVGNNLIQFERQGAGFVRTRKDSVGDVANTMQELSGSYGVDQVLEIHSQSYLLNDLKFDVYSIKDVGEFVIQTGDDPRPEHFALIGITEPEFVTVPFNELPKRRSE